MPAVQPKIGDPTKAALSSRVPNVGMAMGYENNTAADRHPTGFQQGDLRPYLALREPSMIGLNSRESIVTALSAS
jgi:hypothetical protein